MKTQEAIQPAHLELHSADPENNSQETSVTKPDHYG